MLIVEDPKLLTLPTRVQGPTIALPRTEPIGGGVVGLVIPVWDYRGKPMLYVPPGPASAKRPSLPVIQSVSVLDAENLRVGIPREIEREGDEGTWIPPWVERAAMLVSAFLGRLANDDLIRGELRRAVGLYRLPVQDLDVDLPCHVMAWEAWEAHPERWTPDLQGEIPWRRLYDFDIPFAGLKAYALPHDYREAILHLCARERMGNMWPRPGSFAGPIVRSHEGRCGGTDVRADVLP